MKQNPEHTKTIGKILSFVFIGVGLGIALKTPELPQSASFILICSVALAIANLTTCIPGKLRVRLGKRLVAEGQLAVFAIVLVAYMPHLIQILIYGA